MTGPDAMHLQAAHGGARLDLEGRPDRRPIPSALLGVLAAITLVFGGALTLFLPWNAFSLLSEREGMDLPSRVFFGLFALFGFLLLVRWCIVHLLAFRAHLAMRYRPPSQPSRWPRVSILVPAYQEAENIESALRSLTELDYPDYEIIVVDDGSADATYDKAKAFAARFGALSVLRKPNGGKWSAMNLAFQKSSGELILCIDADSRLRRDALRRLVPHLSDPRNVAVSGQVTVRNRCNVLTRLQALEYVVSNGGLRTAQSALGMVLVVPGPIGLYKRSILQQILARTGTVRWPLRPGAVAGPVSSETFAEDFQLSLTALALGGRIVYEPRALSYTRVPQGIPQILNQRYRWIRGTLQVLDVYKRRLRNVSPDARGRLDFVVRWFCFLDAWILPPITFALLIAFFVILSSGAPANVVLWWIAAVLLLNFMTSTYYILSQEENLSLLQMVPALYVYQALLINSIWVAAVFDKVRKTRMDW